LFAFFFQKRVKSCLEVYLSTISFGEVSSINYYLITEKSVFSLACKAKLKAALFQYQQVVTKVTSFEFEAFDERQLETLLAEGRERLKSQVK
jgi:hypothetical protein